jgi:undecaprenyl-diphosphatase
MMERLHQIELEWIRVLHQYRTPWLDSWFIFSNHFDTAFFTVSLILIVSALVSWKIGIRMAIIFTISFLLNKLLKYAFNLPRPNHLDPSLGLVNPASPGFPSVAAQSAVLFAGILILESRRWWRFIVGPLFALNLCFSRIYLGVHFPSDILGGLFAGFILLWIYSKYLRQ